MVSLLTTKNNSSGAIQQLLNHVVEIEVGSPVLIGETEKKGDRQNIQFNKDRMGVVVKMHGATKADVKPTDGALMKGVKMCLLRHENTLLLTDQKITIAREHRESHGPGGSTPETETQEYKIIEQYQMDEFLEWVMQDIISSTCKMSARNLKAGHMRFLRHKITKEFNAMYKGAIDGTPLSWNVFEFLLSDPIFVVLGPDHCVCPQCYTLAFRAMRLRGSNLFDLIALQLGEHEVKHMRTRMNALASFLTTERANHLEFTSHDGHHCAMHLCGSSTDERYDQPCTHERVVPDTRNPPGPQRPWHAVGARVGTTKKTRTLHPATKCMGKGHANCFPQRNNQCEHCDHEPKNKTTVGKSMVICEFCQVVACRGAKSGKACADKIAGDKLGPLERRNAVFTCKHCQNDKNLDRHTGLCGLCDETTVFLDDVKMLIRRACGDSIDSNENQEDVWTQFIKDQNTETEHVTTSTFKLNEHVGVWWPTVERIYLATLVAVVSSSSSSSSSATTHRSWTIVYDDAEEEEEEEEEVVVLESRLRVLQFVTVREKRTRDNWKGVVINTDETADKPFQVAAVDNDEQETNEGKAWWYSEIRLVFKEEETPPPPQQQQQQDQQEPPPPPVPSIEEKLLKYGVDLLRAVDHLDRHQIRVGMQARYKPTMLELIVFYKLYNIFYGISDFWAKFEGVAKVKANCQNTAKTSVEGHVIIGLIPPAGLPEVNWASFDSTCVTVGAFFVLYVTQISQTTAQDWRQMMCNRIALFRLLKKMFPHVNGIFCQSDGAYNTNAMSLHMASLGRLTGIHVLANCFNEAGHGGERVDSTGAGCIGHMWRWHAMTKIPVESPRLQATALDWKPLAGHVVRILDHDPRMWDAVDHDKKFPVPCRDNLMRVYPVPGICDRLFSARDLTDYSGGVVFYRFTGKALAGLGGGVGFTKETLSAMRGGNAIDVNVVVSSVPSGTRDTPETATYDLSKQDRQNEIKRLEELHSRREEEKQDKMHSDRGWQRKSEGKNKHKAIQAVKLERKKQSNEDDDDDVVMGEQTDKITKSDALQQLRHCVKENFAFRRRASKEIVSRVRGINFCVVDRSLVECDKVEIQNGKITNIAEDSKLWDHGVLNWEIVVDEPDVEGDAEDTVRLERPMLHRVPRRGYSQRPHEGNKQTTALQKEFLKTYARNKPKLVNAARLSVLSKTMCGELMMLEPEQITRYAVSWERNQKELKNKAFERTGMPSYHGLEVPALRKLCEQRQLGIRKNYGVKKLTSLLEDYDDENMSSDEEESDSD